MYDYVYIICLYSDSARYLKTLKGQFIFLQNYKYFDPYGIPSSQFGIPLDKNQPRSVLAIVSIRGSANPEIEEDIKNLAKEVITKPTITVMVDRQPNWGGTIGALWDSWKYILEGKIQSNYVVLVEDDWLGNNWALREKLVDDGYIYVGMQLGTCDSSHYAFLKRGFRWVPCHLRSFQGRLEAFLNGKITEYRWSDGGFYFLKYSSLKEIENKMGCFTKAPRGEQYDWTAHGIDYGEAGFPSELTSLGYNIIILGPDTVHESRSISPDNLFLSY